jgi:hypothetical protein
MAERGGRRGREGEAEDVEERETRKGGRLGSEEDGRDDAGCGRKIPR